MTHIEFQSPQQFENAVLAFIEAQQALYRTTVTALAAHNLLTPSEAQQSLPEMYVSIDDTRGFATDPASRCLRWGQQPGYVVFAGQKVGVQRPRVRTRQGKEVQVDT